MKRMFLILFLFLMISGRAFPEIINGIACKVGKEVITIHDFEIAYQQEKIKARFTGTPVPDKKSVMDSLVDNLLIKMESESRGIVVTEEELDQIVNNVIDQNKMTKEEFVKELGNENLSLETVRDNYRNDVLKMRLISQITSKEINNVTDKEAKEFYDAPENKQLFMVPGLVELSRIFIPVPEGISYKEAKQIKNQALEIYEKASQGADFQKLIDTYADTPEKMSKSGALGSFTKEQLSAIMSPDGAENIFSLNSGDVTYPTMILDGYYIYKIGKMQKEKHLSYKEAYENIISYLIKLKGEKAFKEWLQEKRQVVSIHYMIELE